MNNWDEATAYARTLPDVVMESWWGTLCPKINGKGLMSPGREKGSFGLVCTMPEKEILLETDPDSFWQTAHYANYPMILVRFGTESRERIELYIQRAWWDRAKKPQRIAAGMPERP
ncbi:MULTISPECIES: hypothetical protein [unclassified Sphingomonas]|uniref:hypothetical protein n=1 Tax=unclassified Sphingomonas TaxID=196159 RepID=UPI0022B30494|nr:hypothetical protein [Sphingomonas sp. NIBR02145]WHU03127.1 hypothetical protein O3305_00490 [Sphingomonas sp. NIBR02145]